MINYLKRKGNRMIAWIISVGSFSYILIGLGLYSIITLTDFYYENIHFYDNRRILAGILCLFLWGIILIASSILFLLTGLENNKKGKDEN